MASEVTTTNLTINPKRDEDSFPNDSVISKTCGFKHLFNLINVCSKKMEGREPYLRLGLNCVTILTSSMLYFKYQDRLLLFNLPFRILGIGSSLYSKNWGSAILETVAYSLLLHPGMFYLSITIDLISATKSWNSGFTQEPPEPFATFLLKIPERVKASMISGFGLFDPSDVSQNAMVPKKESHPVDFDLLSEKANPLDPFDARKILNFSAHQELNHALIEQQLIKITAKLTESYDKPISNPLKDALKTLIHDASIAADTLKKNISSNKKDD